MPVLYFSGPSVAMPPFLSFLLLSLLSAAGSSHGQHAQPRYINNVPVFYGNWVPIGNAKSLLEKVASNIEAAQGHGGRHQVHQAEERVDVQQHHHHEPVVSSNSRPEEWQPVPAWR